MKAYLILSLCFCFGVGRGSGATWWQQHAAKFTCSRPGYFINEGDCRSFYRCVDKSTWNKPSLQRYDFTCPNGMVFDPSVSVCTNPGPNGCAEPWWPDNKSGGGNNSPSRSFGGGRPGRPSSGNGGGNSLETLPSIFQSSKGPEDNGDDLDLIDLDNDIGFNKPSGDSDLPWIDSVSKPQSPSRPGSGSGVGPFGNRGTNKPAAANPFNDKPGGPLTNPGGGGDGDLDLDFDFGSDLDSEGPGENLEPSFGKPSGSSSTEPSNRKNDAGPPSWGSSETTSGSPNSEGSSSSSTESSRPAPGFNRPAPGDPWDRNGSGSSSSSTEPDFDFDLDGWNNGLDHNNDNNSPGGSSPNSPSNEGANWGGASRPTTSTPPPSSFDNSPWRPTGPWGSGSNDLKPGKPSAGDSWWDPPVALPLRPPHPSITAPPPRPPPLELQPPRPANPSYVITARPPIVLRPRPANPSYVVTGPPPPPPPGPWANPFRPKYPLYEIVAYPTWPGQEDRHDRRPIIIVYSNSKKK